MARPRKVQTNLNATAPPSPTPEGRENQLIAMAYDLAEKQMREGTASSQVISHFLKLGSTKDRLEREILFEQKKLISAKTGAIESQANAEELYAEAIKAFGLYTGEDPDQDEDVY